MTKTQTPAHPATQQHAAPTSAPLRPLDLASLKQVSGAGYRGGSPSNGGYRSGGSPYYRA